jgi:small subunit ribosomal protein S1
MTTDVHGEATGDAPHAADPAPDAPRASSDPAQPVDERRGEEQRGEEQPGDPASPEASSPRQPFGYGKHRVRIGSQRWQAPRAKTQPGQTESKGAAPAPVDEPVEAPSRETASESAAPVAEPPALTETPTAPAPAEAPMTFPPPRKKTPLPSDLERELDEALEGIDLGSALASPAGQAAAAELEPEQRIRGRVAKIHRDDLFVDLGGRNQGIVPLHHFASPPAIGAMIDVVVVRFLADEGLYDIVVPGAAVDVASWAQLAEGMIVDAMITGHNKGGLECEVSRLRGFIPISQVALYRVENLEEFVGQKFTCVVTEARTKSGCSRSLPWARCVRASFAGSPISARSSTWAASTG